MRPVQSEQKLSMVEHSCAVSAQMWSNTRTTEFMRRQSRPPDTGDANEIQLHRFGSW